MKIKLGMSPISWTNDDLPELGGETTLETCLSETLEAGFIGTELGGKFPKNNNELKSALAKNNLKLISGWYSGTLINNDIESEIVRITPQLNLFKDVGASVIVYGETFNTVQNKIEIPLNKRPKLNQYDINEYGKKLTKLAEHCTEQGVPLTFHHHMGTAVESEDEINKVMLSTGKDVGLLLDTGHLYFAEGSYKNILSKFGDRINHVHTKDIRLNILKTHNAMCTVGSYQFTSPRNTKGAIYMVRDPRDVIVSLSDHMGLDHEQTYHHMSSSYNYEYPSSGDKRYEKSLMGTWSDPVSYTHLTLPTIYSV